MHYFNLATSGTVGNSNKEMIRTRKLIRPKHSANLEVLVNTVQRKLQIRDSEIRDKVPYLTQNRKMANKGLFKSPLLASEF